MDTLEQIIRLRIENCRWFIQQGVDQEHYKSVIHGLEIVLHDMQRPEAALLGVQLVHECTKQVPVTH